MKSNGCYLWNKSRKSWLPKATVGMPFFSSLSLPKFSDSQTNREVVVSNVFSYQFCILMSKLSRVIHRNQHVNLQVEWSLGYPKKWRRQRCLTCWLLKLWICRLVLKTAWLNSEWHHGLTQNMQIASPAPPLDLATEVSTAWNYVN